MMLTRPTVIGRQRVVRGTLFTAAAGLLLAGGCGRDGGVQDPLRCGNGVLDTGELCDDGNTRAGDGCGASCAVESAWTCSGQPSVCRALNPSQILSTAVKIP